MIRKALKSGNPGGKQTGKPVSIYVHLGNKDKADYPMPQQTTTASDNFTFCLFVDYRQGIARSYYLIPPTIRSVNVTIEEGPPGIKVVEFLDNHLHTFHHAETTVSGILIIKVSEFLDGCCYLRLGNGRLLCISIDKWPALLPPFLRIPPV